MEKIWKGRKWNAIPVFLPKRERSAPHKPQVASSASLEFHFHKTAARGMQREVSRGWIYQSLRKTEQGRPTRKRPKAPKGRTNLTWPPCPQVGTTPKGFWLGQIRIWTCRSVWYWLTHHRPVVRRMEESDTIQRLYPRVGEHLASATWSASGDQVHLPQAAATARPRHRHLCVHREPRRGVVTIPVFQFYMTSVPTDST